MTDVAALVTSLGGMAQKQQLVRLGARDLDLTRAVRRGEAIRARQGWYTTLPAGDARVRAVRVGGRLTGLSAIRAWGGWVLGEHPLHVSVPVNAARLRTQHNRHRRLNVKAPGGVVLHWDDEELRERGDVMSVSLRDALHRVICDESLETAIAAVDWAMRTGQLDDFGFEKLMLGVPRHKRIPRDWVDPACDSLPESLARTRFRLEGFSVRSQVMLQTGEPLDLVVEDFVGIDVDGREFHQDRFLRDRRKDIHATIEDFHVLRPPASSVFGEWDLLLAAVHRAVAGRRARAGASIRGTADFENSGARPRKRPNRAREARNARELLNFRKRNGGGAGIARGRSALGQG